MLKAPIDSIKKVLDAKSDYHKVELFARKTF